MHPLPLACTPSNAHLLLATPLRPPTSGAVGAISCVGGFGNHEQMRRVNGTANAVAMAAAKAAGIPRFAYVSAFIPPVPGFDVIAKVGACVCFGARRGGGGGGEAQACVHGTAGAQRGVRHGSGGGRLLDSEAQMHYCKYC